MEGAPSTNETDSDDNDSSRKKKKRGSDRAPVILTPPAEAAKAESAKADDTAESLWARLLSNEAEDGDKKKDTDEAVDDHADDNGELAAAEIPAEQSVEELGNDEAAFVIERLALARQQEISVPENEPADNDPEANAAHDFLDKIIELHQTPAEAAVETVQNLTHESPAITAKTENVGSEPGEAPRDFEDGETVLDLRRPAVPEVPEEAAHDFASLPPLAPTGFGEFGRPESAVPIAVGKREQPAGYDKSDVVGAALVGGIVGYLIGRRRGRIKTEKRLLPVQKKLETQVKSLRQELAGQEFAVRQAAAEQAKRPLSVAAERLRPLAVAHQERQQLGQVLIAAAEAKPQYKREIVNERRVDNKVKTAETPLPPKTKPAIEKAPVAPLDKHVETLNQPDLLELSSKIVVEGTSLRQVYESHQIGEGALRRIVSEHLRGGNTGEALSRELTQHEIDFERDPLMRDRDHSRPRSASGVASPLNALIERADATIGRQPDDTAVFEARAAHESRVTKQTKRQNQVVTASLTGVIVVLLAVVIVLYLTRH